jgi:hypothetical protein
MLVSLERPPIKILLHEAKKGEAQNSAKTAPAAQTKSDERKAQRRTHAGLAPSNSFVLPAMTGEIGAGLGLALRVQEGKRRVLSTWKRGKTCDWI